MESEDDLNASVQLPGPGLPSILCHNGVHIEFRACIHRPNRFHLSLYDIRADGVFRKKYQEASVTSPGRVYYLDPVPGGLKLATENLPTIRSEHDRPTLQAVQSRLCGYVGWDASNNGVISRLER